MAAIRCTVQIDRKQADLPAFVVLPAKMLEPWQLMATTTVEGTIDGEPLGRRSLKRWDAGRWFLELRRETLDAIGKGPGESAELRLELASADLPAELQELIDRDSAARERWLARTESQRRMVREDVLGAKSSAARRRRAERALQPVAAPAVSRGAELGAEPASISVQILGQRLLGRRCGPYHDVSVGLADRAAGIVGLVAADVRRARWTTVIEVRGGGPGGPTFRGPAVQGPRDRRFLYLNWIGRLDSAPASMFRRAKLRLDAVPVDVLAKAMRSGVLLGSVDLVAPDGMPLCASVVPPTIEWSSG